MEAITWLEMCCLLLLLGLTCQQMSVASLCLFTFLLQSMFVAVSTSEYNVFSFYGLRRLRFVLS